MLITLVAEIRRIESPLSELAPIPNSAKPLPTFTFPPYTVTPVIIPRVAPSTVQTDSGSLPPILPILALGALGLLGLLVSLLRRL